MTTRCHICGLDVGVSPWGKGGQEASYIICPCCGCQFGQHDRQASGVIRERKRWIEGGGQWRWLKDKPDGWSFQEQVKRIPNDLPPGIVRDVEGF